MKHSLTHPPAHPGRSADRSSALKPSLLERLDQALWRARQHDLEQALEGASDAADLEDKLRRFQWRSVYRCG